MKVKLNNKIVVILTVISCLFSLYSCNVKDIDVIELHPINRDISLLDIGNYRQFSEEVPLLGQGGFESTGENQQLLEEITQISTEPTSLYYSVYRVKPGDMVGRLAESFGVTEDTIISVNNIKQTRRIQIGEYFKIPNMPGILYTVRKKGETVDSIAKTYGVSAEKCSLVNNIEQTKSLDAGVSLFVPDAELDWVTRQEINGDLFKRPLKGRYYFSSYFGWRNSPFTGARTYHNGIDMAATTGMPIYAALAGTVTTAGWSNVYGNYVIVTHHSGYKTLYAHMSEIRTRVGRIVDTNSVLGLVGNTGQSTGPHLHFTIFKNNVAVNPVNLWK